MNRGTLVVAYGILVASLGMGIVVGGVGSLVYEGIVGSSAVHDPMKVVVGSGILTALGALFAIAGKAIEEDLQ